METKKYKAILKSSHKTYLSGLSEQQRLNYSIEKRFTELRKKLVGLLRKVSSSANSVKSIPAVSKLLFGLQEDLIRLSLPSHDFETEKKIINEKIIAIIEQKRSTQYEGECSYYGETLLNIYLDVLITLTSLKTSRKMEYKPGFLVSPISGSKLEIDVLLEDFLLAFEFQGESHYKNEKEQRKDAIKLELCARNRFILIPVNIYQLKSITLMKLICNSIKDSIGLDSYGKKFDPLAKSTSLKLRKKHLYAYKKSCQRIYLASTLFKESLEWVDNYAERYHATQEGRNPISSSTDAPRLTSEEKDLSVKELYINLKYVKDPSKGTSPDSKASVWEYS